MRVNPDSYAGLLSALGTARNAQSRATQQLASGRRVGLVSEDAAAWTMQIQNNSRSAANDEFLHSIASVRAGLNTADSTLSSVVTSLQRAITLGVEGANGTQTAENRKALAQEVSGIRDQMLSLANVSYNGIFVFAGTQNDSPPFKKDPAGTDAILYYGNSATIDVRVGETRSIQTNFPGDELFAKAGASVFDSLDKLATALNTNDKPGITSATSEVRAAFNHVTSVRVFFGNAMNQIDADETFLNGQKLQFAARENELVGADPMKSATDLTEAEFAYKSALAAAGKTSTLSLLDYLR